MISGFLFLGSSLIYYLITLIMLIVLRQRNKRQSSIQKRSEEIRISTENTARNDDTIPTIIEDTLSDIPARKIPSYRKKKHLTIEIPSFDENPKSKKYISRCDFPLNYFRVNFIQNHCFPLCFIVKENDDYSKVNRLTVWFLTFSIENLILFVIFDNELIEGNLKNLWYPIISTLCGSPVCLIFAIMFRKPVLLI